MLTDKEKDQLRLMICDNPTPENMKIISSLNDDEVRQRLESWKIIKLERIQIEESNILFQQENLSSRLSMLQEQKELLQ